MEAPPLSTGYVIPLDPIELSNRFSAYEPLLDDSEEDWDDDSLAGLSETVSVEEMQAFFEEGNDYQSKVEPLLPYLPEREADLIELYYLHGKRQAEIADIFGVTQAAISYRLARGIHRIRFLLSIPQVTEEELRRDLGEVFPQKLDVDILVGMWETTCQSEVALRLKLTQGRVRHRFFKAVKILEEAAEENEKYEPYRKIFGSVANKNFNVLREVKLPQWGGKGGDACI